MTIEFSMRRRAAQSRYLAILWLSLAVVILVGTYTSIPMVAQKISRSIATSESSASVSSDERMPTHIQVYTVGTLALGLLVVSFACFLLGRSALVEIELAARFNAFADALCISGGDVVLLEKFANILMPNTKYLSDPELLPLKDVGSLVELMKQLHPTK